MSETLTFMMPVDWHTGEFFLPEPYTVKHGSGEWKVFGFIHRMRGVTCF